MSQRRVLRGGSCLDVTWNLRPAGRYWVELEERFRLGGFRIVAVRRKP